MYRCAHEHGGGQLGAWRNQNENAAFFHLLPPCLPPLTSFTLKSAVDTSAPIGVVTGLLPSEKENVQSDGWILASDACLESSSSPIVLHIRCLSLLICENSPLLGLFGSVNYLNYKMLTAVPGTQ